VKQNAQASAVSVGQQVLFGLGAYFAVRLSSYDLTACLAILAAPIGVGLIALPLSSVMLRLKGGELAIGMWVIAEFEDRFHLQLLPIGYRLNMQSKAGTKSGAKGFAGEFWRLGILKHSGGGTNDRVERP
jgi:hypothetical protein